MPSSSEPAVQRETVAKLATREKKLRQYLQDLSAEEKLEKQNGELIKTVRLSRTLVQEQQSAPGEAEKG